MFLKRLLNKTAKPFISWYLKSPRNFSFKEIHLLVQPGVFHPGLFFSTKFLLQQFPSISLKDKSFLEVGAGSGLISIYAHKAGAKVTASDISINAIENIKLNQEQNHCDFNVICSDLFTSIPAQQFDLIAINPPYYKKDPINESEQAWYCGKDMEYFKKLFHQIGDYMHPASKVLMVLSDGCDVEGIRKIASNNNVELIQKSVKKNLIESLFIYELRKT